MPALPGGTSVLLRTLTRMLLRIIVRIFLGIFREICLSSFPLLQSRSFFHLSLLPVPGTCQAPININRIYAGEKNSFFGPEFG